MLHRYNVELYLTYNCMTLYDRTPDSEFRVELENPFVWELNQIVQIKEENLFLIGRKRSVDQSFNLCHSLPADV